MAFGKDPSQVTNFSGTYRQQAAAYQAQKKKKRGGGGGAPTWVNKFQPSTSEIDLVRLIPTMCKIPIAIDKDTIHEQELPYMTYVEHWDGSTEKSSVCSAGPFRGIKGKGLPCNGCDIFWGTMTTDPKNNRMKRGNRMSMREMTAFSVLHYAPYAKVAQLDQHGQPKINEATNQPYMNWERVMPHEKAKYAGAEIAHARLMQWPMGMSHFNTLWTYDEEIGKSCSTCSGRNTVTSLAWCCSNPNCGEAVIEMDSTTFPPEKVKELTLSRTTCPRCKETNFLSEVFECQNCTPAGRDAKRATLFNVDLSVRRVPASDGGNQTTLMVTNWSDPRPIDPQYAEMAKPMPLEKIYQPTPMDMQLRLFGPPPSVVRTPVNTQASPYSR